MIEWLYIVQLVLATAAGCLAVILGLAKRKPSNLSLGALAIVEFGLVIQFVVSIVLVDPWPASPVRYRGVFRLPGGCANGSNRGCLLGAYRALPLGHGGAWGRSPNRCRDAGSDAATLDRNLLVQP
jgi:hypothetical protein